MDVLQTLDATARLPRHRHAAPYAAIVLRGGYHEAGDGGRFEAEPGDVLFHLPFMSHMDRVNARRTAVLNLPLPVRFVPVSLHQRSGDPDGLARLAERDPQAAAQLLTEQLLPGRPAANDPVDQLARRLGGPDAPSILEWSANTGIRRETAFRWFVSAYGVSPTQFHVEARARHAWRAIAAGTSPLGRIATDLGFADQAHMSRAVRALTGFPPTHWRASGLQHSFKTACS